MFAVIPLALRYVTFRFVVLSSSSTYAILGKF